MLEGYDIVLQVIGNDICLLLISRIWRALNKSIAACSLKWAITP